MCPPPCWNCITLLLEKNNCSINNHNGVKPVPALDYKKELKQLYNISGNEAVIVDVHIGPYNTEGPDVAKLHSFIMDRGYVLSGKHHEIYLSDPRRVKPDKLRTLIRQPIAVK